jgi:uncharacterized metal-binding protein YceD (DUF177 family)
MPLLVNLCHLEAHNVLLEGELPVEELDLDTRDEMIQAKEPLQYDFEVQKLEHSLLVQGRLQLTLDCQCVRCLKSFNHTIKLDNWASHLPLQGEESVAVVNDCVDLTPYIREDILLELPRHPLCDAECRGLPNSISGKAAKPLKADQPETGSTAWSELNKLKF